MRLPSAVLAVICLPLQPVLAEDVRDQEIMVIDQNCVEQKVTSCLIDSFSKRGYKSNHFSSGCPKGSQPYGLSHNNDTNQYTVICQFTDIAAVIARPWDELGPIISECRNKAEGLPSQYGSVSCLRPLAQERIINALNVELKRLSRQLCDASGGSKCVELDKVPEQ